MMQGAHVNQYASNGHESMEISYNNESMIFGSYMKWRPSHSETCTSEHMEHKAHNIQHGQTLYDLQSITLPSTKESSNCPYQVSTLFPKFMFFKA